MEPLAQVLAVSDFWGGDGKTWLAVLIVVVLLVLSALALYNARNFVKKI
jgi:hypothetical protein